MIGMKEILKCYNYTPRKFLKAKLQIFYWIFKLTIYWLGLVFSTVIASNTDNIIQDKMTNKLYIIDSAIPADANIVKKRIEKIDKYIDLFIELKTSVECYQTPNNNNSSWCKRSDIEKLQA